MKYIRIGAAASALALASVTLPAVAAAPVQIQSCQILRAPQPNLGPYNYYPYGYYYGYGVPFGYPNAGALVTDGVSIKYRNLTSKTANRVAFGVDYRGDRNVVVDVGTFSPNVSIDHQFGEFSGLAFLGSRPNGCRVLAVRFTDGTFYRAPGMERRQAR